jgi:hypothetical protein
MAVVKGCIAEVELKVEKCREEIEKGRLEGEERDRGQKGRIEELENRIELAIKEEREKNS